MDKLHESMTMDGRKKANKFQLQEQQYAFPYHYIPSFDSSGHAQRYRLFGKGLEYLCYVKHVVDLAESFEPESVLDVGCGDGRVIGDISARIRRVGVDPSEQAIGLARVMNPGVEFYATTAAELDGAYDVVLAVEVLEHIPDNEIPGFFQAIEDRTRAGGRVILTVPSVIKPVIEKHYRHYNRSLFEKHLAASGTGLQIEKVEYVYRDSRLMRLYRRVTNNRLWYAELHFLRKLIWRYVWQRLRVSAEEYGQHLVITLRRS